MKNATPPPHQPCMTFFNNLWSEVATVERCPLFAASRQPESVTAALAQPETLLHCCLVCLRNFLDCADRAD